MLESAIEAAIRKHAIKTGWLCYKFSSPAHRGVPDRIFFSLKGEVALIEVKAPGKKPTPLQARELAILQARGIAADWFDNVSAACAWLDKHNT